MELTLRGETIAIELGQEVIFYQYILNNDKVEFREDKVVVDLIEEEFNGIESSAIQVGFRNDEHNATLCHYELGNFYLSINDKNVLDFLERKYSYYKKREKQLQSEIESLSKQIESLNNNSSKLNTLIQEVSLRILRTEG